MVWHSVVNLQFMETLSGPERNQLDGVEHDSLMALREVPWTEAIHFSGRTFSVSARPCGDAFVNVTINQIGSGETIAFLYNTEAKLLIGRYDDAVIGFVRSFLLGYQRVSRV